MNGMDVSEFPTPHADPTGTAIGYRGSNTRTAFLFQTTALVLVSLFGSGINSLVALVFYRRPSLRSPSNRFVLSLIVANLLASVVVVPVVLAQLIYNDIVIGVPWLQQMAQGLSTLAVTASVFSVLTIAVDRYNAVLSPLHYTMTITRQRSRAMIACAWLVAALLAMRHALGPHSEFPSCERGQLFRLAYTLVLVSLGFTLPLFALCWIYARLYNAAHANSERTRRHSITTSLELPSSPPPTTTPSETPRRTGKNPPLGMTSTRRRASNASFSTLLFREEGRAVKTATMVISSYILCWTPYFAALLADAWDDEIPPIPEPVRFVALLAAFSSGCITPFIYVFRNEAARREAVKLLLWWRRGKYGSNVTRDFESFSAKSASLSLPQISNDAPPIRRQSLSYCDSVSVQSLHIPSECRHCTDPAPSQPLADFVATYEVVNSPTEGSPKITSSPTDTKTNDDDRRSRTTRRESVTFRLALLPQRRCQTCIRQNSDSSTSSGHPLIDSDTPPMISAVAARRAQLRRQGSSSGDEPGTPRTRVHSAEEDRRSNSTVILELDEQIRSAGIPRTAAVFQFQETSLERSISEDCSASDRRGPQRQDSDVTVDSGVVSDLGRSVSGSSSSLNLCGTSTCLIRPPPLLRHRPQLQRLAAVEDEDSTLPSEDSLLPNHPTAIVLAAPPRKDKPQRSAKIRFHRPAFRVPNCDF